MTALFPVSKNYVFSLLTYWDMFHKETSNILQLYCSAVLWLYFKFYLFIYFCLWLCCVFVSVRGLSLVAASGGHSSLHCVGLSLSRPLLLRSTGSRCAGSVIVAHGPSRSTACGIFPDQGSNPRPPHWQADSQPLRHQGSPLIIFYHILTKWSNSVMGILVFSKTIPFWAWSPSLTLLYKGPITLLLLLSLCFFVALITI